MRPTSYPKPCPGCGQTKGEDEYTLKKTGGTARRGRCKSCCRSDKNEFRGRDRDRSRALYRESYYRRKDLHPNFNRQVSLRKNHGLTLEEFDARLAEQGGVCAVCGTDDPKGRHKQFVVDHDHSSLAFRGILCNPCNLILGLVEDDQDRLLNMVKYLKANS